jgi:rRNA maturation protein Nop10
MKFAPSTLDEALADLKHERELIDRGIAGLEAIRELYGLKPDTKDSPIIVEVFGNEERIRGGKCPQCGIPSDLTRPRASNTFFRCTAQLCQTLYNRADLKFVPAESERKGTASTTEVPSQYEFIHDATCPKCGEITTFSRPIFRFDFPWYCLARGCQFFQFRETSTGTAKGTPAA